MIDLSQYQELVVRQSRELIEVFTEFETANKYKILTPDGGRGHVRLRGVRDD